MFDSSWPQFSFGRISLKTVALIANGTLEDSQRLKNEILEHSRIVAVDGGFLHCQTMGIVPDGVVGDFDSWTQDLPSGVPVLRLPQHKDHTDLEVAIQKEFEGGADQITLYGAWGGRIDHSLTNALLLGRYPKKLRLKTSQEILFAIDGFTELAAIEGQTLSLIPLYGPATGITTSGLKWELDQGRLDMNFIGISNQCMQALVTIQIEHGLLLCAMLL
jgi:thiamine pyrophosphokinase